MPRAPVSCQNSKTQPPTHFPDPVAAALVSWRGSMR
jgi:hypothetical protein